MNNWESVGTGQPIVMTNLNRSIVLAVSETLTAIKQLVFALHTHTHTHTLTEVILRAKTTSNHQY
jgi:hypothetical protein